MPRSQPQRSNTLENLSACSTRIILISQPQFFRLLTLYYRWLDQQSSPWSFPNKSKEDQLTTLTNELNGELHLIFIVFLDEFG